MDQPVYKLFLVKYTEAWYQLSEEEQQKHDAMIEEMRNKVGGELVVFCVSLIEDWAFWGVEKFPNMEAYQKHLALLYNQKNERYIEALTFLGLDMPSVLKVFDSLG